MVYYSGLYSHVHGIKRKKKKTWQNYLNKIFFFFPQIRNPNSSSGLLLLFKEPSFLFLELLFLLPVLRVGHSCLLSQNDDCIRRPMFKCQLKRKTKREGKWPSQLSQLGVIALTNPHLPGSCLRHRDHTQVSWSPWLNGKWKMENEVILFCSCLLSLLDS